MYMYVTCQPHPLPIFMALIYHTCSCMCERDYTIYMYFSSTFTCMNMYMHMYYNHISDVQGHMHFCVNCGTAFFLYLTNSLNWWLSCRTFSSLGWLWHFTTDMEEGDKDVMTPTESNRKLDLNL